MKKLLAALAALLILAGCSPKETPADMVGVTVVTTKPAEETPVEEVPVEEVPVVEAESAPELTEEAPAAAIDTFAVSEDKLEGLVGDTIGYSFDVPVFAGFDAADAVTAFYADLAAHLENYTKSTVNEECLDAGLMASVYGEITAATLTADGLGLQVDYEFRVEYSNQEVERNTRTDTFDIRTGEVESVTD